MKEAGVDLLENFPTEQIGATFEAMLDDWTNEGFDPFAAPQETGSPYGRKNGNNRAADHARARLATRCVGLKGDLALRTDERGAPVNRAFADVPQDKPELHPEPGFENEVHAFNLFAFLSRSQVTWNPCFTSVVKYSFMCPTTEEHILPIIHGNDRVEWFFQMSDEIHWDCARQEHRQAAGARDHEGRRHGRHAGLLPPPGLQPEALMLLVWENGSARRWSTRARRARRRKCRSILNDRRATRERHEPRGHRRPRRACARRSATSCSSTGVSSTRRAARRWRR